MPSPTPWPSPAWPSTRTRRSPLSRLGEGHPAGLQREAGGPRPGPEPAGDYILACSLWDMADLLDLEYLLGSGPVDGTYIYSNSRAYDEEQKVDLARSVELDRALRDEAGGPAAGRPVGEVGVVPGYHASGHAGGLDLVRFVKEVRPRLLIPVHTERPERWLEELQAPASRSLPIMPDPCPWDEAKALPPEMRREGLPMPVSCPFLPEAETLQNLLVPLKYRPTQRAIGQQPGPES